MKSNMCYHNREITKGIYGESSKIQEELDELNDAIEQKDKVLIGCELSDIYGALEGVAIMHGFSMEELKMFSDKTKHIKSIERQKEMLSLVMSQ